MSNTIAAVPSFTSLSSRGEMIVHSASLAKIDVSAEDRVNMIEVDDNCENCSISESVMELTPYPYTPTSEEMADYYQLEQSLGENWSFRLACELSFETVSMDEDDDYMNDDSVTFFDDSHQQYEETMSSPLPEDIEVRTYTRRDNCGDDTVSPVESFSRYEIF
jgi:hypothetical protein